MRIRAMTCAAALAACLAGRADAKPPQIVQPDFVRQPNTEDLEREYPQTALTLSIEGFAALRCRVDAFGKLEDCAAVEESPANLGFGAAAVAMAALFETRPKTVNGAPVDGGVITIPIVFKLPPSEPPPAAAKATPEASALGRRYVAATLMAQSVEAGYAHAADEIEFTNDDAPTAIRSEIAAALRTAIKAHATDLQDVLAQDAETVFSSAELTAVVEAFDGPAGVVMRPDADRDAVSEMLRRETLRRTKARAHDVFCSKYDCDTRSALLAPLDASIQQPIWSEALNQSDLDDMRPAVATSLDLPAAVRLICTIGLTAKPEACRVAAEAPGGLGIGQMVLPLATHYRLAPQLMAQGAQGESVVLTLLFDAPAAVAPFDPPAPRSGRALAVARRAVGYDPATTRTQADAVVSRAMRAMPPGADRAVYTDLATAWAEGAQEAAAWLAEAQARTLAALDTEDQVAAALAYRTSPVAKSYAEKFPSLAATATKSSENLWAQITAEAHDTFCRSHPCAVVRSRATASSTR